MNISRLIGLLALCVGTVMFIAKAAVMLPPGGGSGGAHQKHLLMHDGDESDDEIENMMHDGDERDDEIEHIPPAFFMPYYQPPQQKPVHHSQPTNPDQAKLAALTNQMKLIKMQAEQMMWQDALAEITKKNADAKKAKEKADQEKKDKTFVGMLIKKTSSVASAAGSIFIVVVATGAGLKFFELMNGGVGVGHYAGYFGGTMLKEFFKALFVTAKEPVAALMTGAKDLVGDVGPAVQGAVVNGTSYVINDALPAAVNVTTSYLEDKAAGDSAWTFIPASVLFAGKFVNWVWNA